MKRIQLFGFIALSLLIFSCALPKYSIVYESPKGLDLRTGKWLVNSVGNRLSLADKHYYGDRIVQGFQKMGVDSIDLVGNVWFDYITPDRFQFEISEETLQLLQKTTDYDFILNVKASIIKDEVSSLMLLPPDKKSSSTSELIIVVYDINSGQKIYHQRIVGTIAVSETDNDVRFAKSAAGLLNGALNRGLKEIEEYAAVNK
ncbi:hypothetical protein EO244_15825 [Ancylomarina salipaludis]|uniref:Uncharacterized protein n=1 Tax=Ancylomarina salipaludis TaxID=2501299 RepID=A0A4Q1JHU3_9BACT|nr:hypothetical protein [Ancylomarina salipaludis]RXQ87827.1 hypothetical protein EO244_15825 [Ancylomarina salipaludis]